MYEHPAPMAAPASTSHPSCFLAVYPAPAHVGGQHVCRKPPFPAVPPLDECRRGKRCGGMHRGERMAVAVVGAVFPDAVLQGIRDACRGKGRECPLFQPFPVFLNQYGGQSCHGKQYRSTSPDVRTALREPLTSICWAESGSVRRSRMYSVNAFSFICSV